MTLPEPRPLDAAWCGSFFELATKGGVSHPFRLGEEDDQCGITLRIAWFPSRFYF